MKVSEPVWQPDPATAKNTHMARFMAHVQAHYQLAKGYAPLQAWSVAEPAAFWGELAEYCRLRFSTGADSVFTQGDPTDIRSGQWFSGATLNFAENLLFEPDASTALIFRDERGRRRELSRRELADQVAGLAAAMRQQGLQPGDRIAAVLPNCPEAVIAMLAAASIGAIFSSCSPDFGLQAILKRFRQIQPRWLFVCDGYHYAGKAIDCLEASKTLQAELNTVEQLIVVPFRQSQPDLTGLTGALLFADVRVAEATPEYCPLPFDHALYILYSSGTTGVPKCILHGAGGTLLQHKKELMLHTDLKAGERIFYFTTCGWMMWNWLVSALASKAAVVLYDGSPFHPGPDALLDLAAEENVSVFGTSPRYLSALENKARADGASLSELHTILSTGAPLAPGNFDFVTRHFGAHVQLCSISGGTDLLACFALGNPLLPVFRGELQCKGLGMDVEVFDPQGNALLSGPGELVCRSPFPSMPLAFWGDDSGERYSAAYFERFPGVWTHGDYAENTPNGGLIIRGRSDAVLNPGGVRIGSAEVCDPAMQVDGVYDCIAVGHRRDGDEEIVLFVVLADGEELGPGLIETINRAIRSASSPRHVPARLLQVPEIPRTLSGKAVELAVRAIIHGEAVTNRDAIANPGALEYFRDRL